MISDELDKLLYQSSRLEGLRVRFLNGYGTEDDIRKKMYENKIFSYLYLLLLPVIPFFFYLAYKLYEDIYIHAEDLYNRIVWGFILIPDPFILTYFVFRVIYMTNKEKIILKKVLEQYLFDTKINNGK